MDTIRNTGTAINPSDVLEDFTFNPQNYEIVHRGNNVFNVYLVDQQWPLFQYLLCLLCIDIPNKRYRYQDSYDFYEIPNDFYLILKLRYEC